MTCLVHMRKILPPGLHELMGDYYRVEKDLSRLLVASVCHAFYHPAPRTRAAGMPTADRRGRAREPPAVTGEVGQHSV